MRVVTAWYSEAAGKQLKFATSTNYGRVFGSGFGIPVVVATENIRLAWLDDDTLLVAWTEFGATKLQRLAVKEKRFGPQVSLNPRTDDSGRPELLWAGTVGAHAYLALRVTGDSRLDIATLPAREQ